MKKILCALMVVLILAVVPVTTYASSSRIVTISPGLSFKNNTAYCSVMINANTYDDEIRALVTLYYEGDRIDSWHTFGNAYAVLDETVDISDYGPGTYEVTVVFTINSKAQPTVSMEREYLGN